MMGMRPADFWTMTLVEWRAALAGFSERNGARKDKGGAMRRSELDALVRRFPD